MKVEVVMVEGIEVFFWSEQKRPKLEKVEFVHYSGLPFPLINLSNGKTSVPHKSYVPNATSFFYTLTSSGKEKKVDE